MNILFWVHQMASKGWRTQEIYNPQRAILPFWAKGLQLLFNCNPQDGKKKRVFTDKTDYPWSFRDSTVPGSSTLIFFLSCLHCFCSASFSKGKFLTLNDSSTSHSKKNLITNFALPKQGKKNLEIFILEHEQLLHGLILNWSLQLNL